MKESKNIPGPMKRIDPGTTIFECTRCGRIAYQGGKCLDKIPDNTICQGWLLPKEKPTV